MLKVFFFLFFAFVNLFSQSTLNERINNILSKVPKGTIAAVEIIDAETGQSIYENEATTHVIPASNAKLFSTATALSIMGLNYEFETQLLTNDRNLADNVINGNIYIKGFGNSLFTDKDLDDFVDQLKKLNITQITGDVIGDDSIWDKDYFRESWIEGESANVSVSAVSALVFNRNILTINISGAAKVKNKAIVNLGDDNNYIKVINSCTTVKRKGSPKAVLNFRDNKIILEVSGSIKRNSHTSINVRISNPPLYIASVFYSRLLKAGISVKGIPKEGITEVNSSIITKATTPILDIVNLVNKRSDNFLAECLFKSIGAYKTLKQGNAFYSTQAINQFIQEQDIYSEDVEIVDGSGISRSNNVTVKTMAQLLYNIFKNKQIFSAFKNSLAISGIEGTLRRRMKNGFEGKFYGKTGTLRGVSSLSGYYEPEEGKYYVVSMVFLFSKKDHEFYKDLQDKIIESI